MSDKGATIKDGVFTLRGPRPHPGIYLINLGVLTATTKICADSWEGTSGRIKFIALNYWHPSLLRRHQISHHP
jgi:hypothetical protein